LVGNWENCPIRLRDGRPPFIFLLADLTLRSWLSYVVVVLVD
jgi:hypothetical protein